jgi:hypothetical protein
MIAFHELDAGCEDEFGQFGGIDRRQRPTDQSEDFFNTTAVPTLIE